MLNPRPLSRFALVPTLMMMGAVTLGAYFAFAAVQGEYGLFRQLQLRAEQRELEAEKARLSAELATLTNLTHRLSDGFLDLDLLDERARDVLGYLRADEIVIR